MAHSAQISFGWCTSVLDLSKHTCTTRLSLRRGKKVVVILAWSLNLLGFEPPSQTIWSPFWLIAVVTSSARACAFTRMYLIGFAYVWVRGPQGPGRYRGRAGRCVLPSLSALGCRSVVWCPLSGCSHAKDHTKNAHFFSTRQPPQSRTQQSRHKTVPALKPPVH